MDAPEYCFRFSREAPMADVEETLILAAIAAEGLHGRARVRLEGRFSADPQERTCMIRADTEVGRSIARIFTEMLILEIGDSAFDVSGPGVSVRRSLPSRSSREEK